MNLNHKVAFHLGAIRTDNSPYSKNHKDYRKSYNARLPVFNFLILTANIQARTWHSVQAISNATGYNRQYVREALYYFETAGAIRNLPENERPPELHDLPPQQAVYELTGVISINGETIEYLHNTPPPEEYVKGGTENTGGGYRKYRGGVQKIPGGGTENTPLIQKNSSNRTIDGNINYNNYNLGNKDIDVMLDDNVSDDINVNGTKVSSDDNVSDNIDKGYNLLNNLDEKITPPLDTEIARKTLAGLGYSENQQKIDILKQTEIYKAYIKATGKPLFVNPRFVDSLLEIALQIQAEKVNPLAVTLAVQYRMNQKKPFRFDYLPDMINEYFNDKGDTVTITEKQPETITDNQETEGENTPKNTPDQNPGITYKQAMEEIDEIAQEKGIDGFKDF